MTARNCTTHHKACDCREAMFAEMVEGVRWISEIATINFEQDVKLRSNGARTLKRIADRADALIARATDQGEMK